MANGHDARVLADAGRRTPEALFAAYVEFTKILLSNLFIINGGSAVALIAFLGNVKGESPISPLVKFGDVKFAIAIYGAGAFFAIVAAALTALTESINSSRLEQGESMTSTFGWIAFFCMLISGSCFTIACLAAIDKFI